MILEEFENLKTGDVIKNKISQAKYIVIAPKVPIDPIVQIKKSTLKENKYYESFEIIMKVREKE